MKLMGHSSGVVGVACAMVLFSTAQAGEAITLRSSDGAEVTGNMAATASATGTSVGYSGSVVFFTGGAGGKKGSQSKFAFPPPDSCPADCEAVPDGNVGIIDFLDLLAQWGTLGSCDTDGSGMVDIVDFLDLLAAWGPCP